MKASIPSESRQQLLPAPGTRALNVLQRALQAEQRFIKDELALAPDATARQLVDRRIELQADLDALETLIAGLPRNGRASS